LFKRLNAPPPSPYENVEYKSRIITEGRGRGRVSIQILVIQGYGKVNKIKNDVAAKDAAKI
jgi:hypothetical protein